MPTLNDDVLHSMPKLRERYRCSRGVLTAWLETSVGNDHEGKACTVFALLECVGYKKGQSYLTPKQWSIITNHLDPYLKPEN